MQTPSTFSDVSVPPDTLSSEGQSGSGNDGAQTSVEGGLVNVGVSVSVDSDDDSGKPMEGGSEDVSKTSDVGAIPTTVQTPSTSSDVSLPPDTLSSEGQGGSGNDGAQTSVKGGLINVGVSVSVDSDDGSGKPKEGGSEDGSKTSDVGEPPSTMQTPSTSSDGSVLSDTSSPSTESGSSNQGAQTSVEGGLINVGVSVSVESGDSSGKPKEGGSEDGSKTSDVGAIPTTMQTPSTSSDVSVPPDTLSSEGQSGSGNDGAQTSVEGGLVNVGVSVSVDSDDDSGKPMEGGSEDVSKTSDVGAIPTTVQDT
ncbi:cell wall protein IFF6-like [Homalodisca vitripennis]|uniref:cell wall protein IFF6-like n=1 Tax=Homalodisca vitripennis TaxID=197043 RepID=UPI001EEC4760|nr:cell wall protein IFF6-like [Homalodisca vitripennis]